MQHELPIPKTPPKGYTWRRVEVSPGFRKSNYELLLDGERTGVWVMHCGHPTALRPYYLAGEFWRPFGGPPNDKYRLSIDAKEDAIDTHQALRPKR